MNKSILYWMAAASLVCLVAKSKVGEDVMAALAPFPSSQALENTLRPYNSLQRAAEARDRANARNRCTELRLQEAARPPEQWTPSDAAALETACGRFSF